MAQIHEEILVVKVCTLLRDNVAAPPVLITEEFVNNVENLLQELAGSNTLVEVQVP
jgi:hypothetical protein